MFRRVASNIAEGELRFKDGEEAQKLYEASKEKFLQLMLSRKFMPNSPTLMNAGRELQQLSACFVLPVEDSIESIYDTLKQQALIHKSGGGTGFGFSRLRPKNDLVKSTMGVSSGPVSFMQVFDASTEHIKQGGTRRGANMGILRCLSGDTLLDTVDGPREVRGLVGERPYLFACHPETEHANVVQADRIFVSDRGRALLRVSLDDGSHIDCTPDHRFLTATGSYEEAASLSEGSELRALDPAMRNLTAPQLHLRTLADTGYPKRLMLGHLTKDDHRAAAALVAEPGRTFVAHGEAGTLTVHESLDNILAAHPDLKRSFDFAAGTTIRRVVSVEDLPGTAEEVYDVSMPILHNFSAGEAGVFVHNCDHPDIEEFVRCKSDNDKVNNFNISVAITDEFMEAVEADDVFYLRNPRDGAIAEGLRATELFEKIVEGAHRNGEPGVVFIDRINADNPTPEFPIEGTNPCAEAHLPPYDSCNLGSINLERFVGPDEDGRTIVYWASLHDAVRTAVRFLDDVVEVNEYPLAEIDEMSRGNRRIGLGVMGFADALIQLGIPYDSEEGIVFAREVMKAIDESAWEASRALAKERGVFAHFGGSRHQERDDRVRNATVTTIAPTGTISMIAGCSSGIEPLFAVAFMRRQADMELPDVNPEFARIAKERGFYSEDLMERVARHGSVRDGKVFPDVPEDVRRVWVTAQDISPEWHIRMQAAFQEHTSMGISKTINLPHRATMREVEDAYKLAYETGCKGIAVYRDGSREAQVLSTNQTSADEIVPMSPEREAELQAAFENLGKHSSFLADYLDALEDPEGSRARELEENAPEEFRRDMARWVRVLKGNNPATTPGSTPAPTLAEARNGRPNELKGVTKKLATGHGPLYVTMNDDEFGARECFVILGKPGGTAAAFSDALGRMISLAMTHGAPPEEVVKQLRGIQDGHPAGFGPSAVLSVPDGVAKAMAEYYLSDGSAGPAQAQLPIVGSCPECSGELSHESGCAVCHSCGYSRCS